jgi:hypothetical protein
VEAISNAWGSSEMGLMFTTFSATTKMKLGLPGAFLQCKMRMGCCGRAYGCWGGTPETVQDQSRDGLWK